MMNFKATISQIRELTAELISFGLCDDQTFPIERNVPEGLKELTFRESKDIGIVLKKQDYHIIYDELNRLRAFNIRMLDGALIQLMYLFEENRIKKHRLAFFSSPYLDKFQNNPDIYNQDEIYADVIDKKIVPFPFRFDFESKNVSKANLDHPKSHLTLGEYKNCRIPVTAPLTPYQFIHFILSNFYNTNAKYHEQLKRFDGGFLETIAISERAVIHVQLPSTKKQESQTS